MGYFADILGTLKTTFKIGKASLSSSGLTTARSIALQDLSGTLALLTDVTGVVSTSLTAYEALSAGDWVSIYSDSGTAKWRKANATGSGYRTDGFVLSSVSSGASATGFHVGVNTAVSGQTVGPIFLSTTAGVGSSSVPSTGNLLQRIGFALSPTSVLFRSDLPVNT